MDAYDLGNESSLDDTMKEVMVANNAQFIFEHIKRLENEPKYRQRWIWELMQNAQDAKAKEINIIFEDGVLTFYHNGILFTKKDIAHLIFHGSSKQGNDDDKTGKFGTGFMTTHLLSKTVIIKGNLEDGRYFDFELKREAKDADEMTIALNDSWNNFKSSIKSSSENNVTSFTYLALSVEGILTVENVLNNISFLMPSVLAFSKKIDKVTITNNNETFVYEKIETENSNILTIICTSSTKIEPVYYNLILHNLKDDNLGMIAIPVNIDGSIAILDPKVPRIFINFPLIGTDQAFPLPFLINSRNFEPNDEREKLWLLVDTNQTRINKEILQLAFEEYVNFVKEAISEKRENLHLLADLGQYAPPEWVDGKWYKEQLAYVINEIDNLPLVTVSEVDTEKISLARCFVPSSEVSNSTRDEKCSWILCNFLFPEKIPAQNQAEYWKIILLKRNTFLEKNKHPSTYSLKSICEYIDLIPGHILNNIPTIGISTIDFIQLLISNLEEFNLEKYWSEYAILPDQNGCLRKSGSLQQELLNTVQEIGDTIKEIAEGLNNEVRCKLLNKLITITSVNHKLQEFKKDALVASLLQIVKSNPLESVNLGFEKSSVKLLEWLLQNNLFNDLAGYPVKMRNDKWDRLSLSFVGERFLFPVSLWKEGFQKYHELFPFEYILNDIYKSVFNNQEISNKVIDKNMVLNNPLYSQMNDIGSDEIRMMVTSRFDKVALAEQENVKWVMSDEILFSKIAYFNSPKDKNVLDKARGSFKRTKQLLEFIVEVLLVIDDHSFMRKEIEIRDDKTVKHIGIYPSLWLLDLKDKDWVKDKGTNYANRPSVETFLPYFNPLIEDNILYKSLQRPDVSKFLHFFDIGVGDLLRNIRSGENEEERISWDQSYVMILMNNALTPEKVTGLLSDPAFISAYEEKQIIDKQTRQNQEIGTAVEKAFREAFEKLSNYNIDRKAIGSDFIVESDFPHYLLINRDNKKKFTIEIKSSRSTEVRMTITQGKKTQEEKESYLLCVVPLVGEEINSETIIKNAKFITNISALLKSRVEKVEELRDLQSVVIESMERNTGDVWTSMDGMNVRYVVGQKLWISEGPTVLSFDSFVNGLITNP